MITKIKSCIVLCLIIACAEKGPVSNIANTFNGDKVVPRDANSIFIQDFADFSSSTGIADILVLRIKEEISLDGRLAVLNNDKADLRLEGKIKSYQMQSIQYGDFGRPTRKRLRITASLRLYNLKKKKLIFYEPEIQSFYEFSDVIHPIETEAFVKDKVVNQLAKRISSKIISGWYTEHMSSIEKGKGKK